MEEIGAVEPPRTDAQGLVEEEGRGEEEAGNRNQKPQQLPDGDPDDEEDVCRICRTSGEADSSLYHPCACSGSIKYVHQECLLQWLNHSNARQCEVRFFVVLLELWRQIQRLGLAYRRSRGTSAVQDV